MKHLSNLVKQIEKVAGTGKEAAKILKEEWTNTGLSESEKKALSDSSKT